MLRAPGGLTTLVLHGPEGAGKTRLLFELFGARPELPVEVLDVAEVGPMDLFAEINRSAAVRQVLVLEARIAPQRWYREAENVPPDLLSRLHASPQFHLDRPGADALFAVLCADLSLHGHKLNDAEARMVADRLPRHFGAPRAFCRALDRAGRQPSRRALLNWALERVHVAPKD
ncbi:hypothetical protein GCM10007148_04850 [Parvularcula lutaonensis]|nr:hypothetical protein GCM10007148_04850 [Parvularcula lutaonensis]